MPPYNSPARSIDYGDVRDGRQNWALGFTAPLIDSIAKSKSKLQAWVDHEKSVIDSTVASYRESFAEQEKIINSQVAELTSVQRERGMDDGISNDDNNNTETIAVQKKSLEEQSAKVQIEIMKLKTERDNREKRVQGKSNMIDSVIRQNTDFKY